MPTDPTIVVKNQERPGGADWEVGGVLNINTGGVLNVETGGDLQSNGVSILNSLAAGSVAGVAAGYKLARGVTSVTGATGGDITTGLGTVIAVVAVLGADASLNANAVSAVVGGTAGHITVKVWKPTATGDCTPILSTTATNVEWVAIGTA